MSLFSRQLNDLYFRFLIKISKNTMYSPGIHSLSAYVYSIARRGTRKIYLWRCDHRLAFFKSMFLILFPSYRKQNIQVGIWCQIDVVSTSMRRLHVESTLIRCHFYVMCPLGCTSNQTSLLDLKTQAHVFRRFYY